MRRVSFEIGEYYHIFNRGVESRMIFSDRYDYIRFIRGMREFNRIETIGSLYHLDYLRRVKPEVEPPIGGSTSGFAEKLVEIVCYSLVKNHYHFILKPLAENAIERFMQKLGTSYTMYFNQRYGRSGALFQGRYKSVHIKTNENLLRLSAYVNANIEIHKITKVQNWIWSSYLDYLDLRKGTMCKKADILSQFESVNEYKEFTEIVIKDSQDLKSDIKYYLE